MRFELFIIFMMVLTFSSLLVVTFFYSKSVTASELQATFVFAKDAQGNCFERVGENFKAVSCKESSHAKN